jgi:hypothetical protein
MICAVPSGATLLLATPQSYIGLGAVNAAM